MGGPQIALLSVEMCSLREDNERMKTMAEIREPSEQLQSAIRDRDEAIAKYAHVKHAVNDVTNVWWQQACLFCQAPLRF